MTKRESKAIAYFCTYILSGYVHNRKKVVVDINDNRVSNEDYKTINKAYNDLYEVLDTEDCELNVINIIEKYINTCDQMNVFKAANIYRDKVVNNIWIVFKVVLSIDKDSNVVKMLRKIVNYDFGFGFKAYKIVNKLGGVESHTVEMLNNVWGKGGRNSVYSCKLNDGIIIDFVNDKNKLVANIYENESLLGQVNINKGLADGGYDLVVDMIQDSMESDN